MSGKRKWLHIYTLADAIDFAVKHGTTGEEVESDAAWEWHDDLGNPDNVAAIEFADGAVLVCATHNEGPPWSEVTPDPQYGARTAFWALEAKPAPVGKRRGRSPQARA
jgi:hypothetical protein